MHPLQRGVLHSQYRGMTHPDGIENMISTLKAAGVSDADIDTMLRKNPARLLGL